MDQSEWNFQGWQGWCQVTFGWVVPWPSPHLLALGLHPVLLPEGEQLPGPWCYQVMSYHFGKLLLSKTTLFNHIFYFGPRPRFAGVKRGCLERGGGNFLIISQFCIKQTLPERGRGNVAKVVGCVLFGIHFSQSKIALLLNFQSFQTINTIFTTNQCEKCPSSIWHWDMHPQPFEHEWSPINARRGLPPKPDKLFLTISTKSKMSF